MKRNTLLRLASLVVAVCLISSLVACGTGNAGSPADTKAQKETTATTKAEPAKEEEPVELSFWNSVSNPDDANAKRWDAAVKQTEADLGVKIDYQAITGGGTFDTKVKVALAGNELPDILQMFGGGSWDPFLNANALAPLDDALASSGMKDKYIEGYLIKIGQSVLSVPIRPNHQEVMFYNKEIFNTVGIKVPTNWDEFVKVIEAVTAKGYYALGVGEKGQWMGDLFYNSMVLREDPLAFQKAMKGEMKFTDKPFADATAKLKKLIDINAFPKGYMTIDEPEVIEMFAAGKIAIFPEGTWNFAGLIAKLGDKFGYAPIPALGADTKPEENAVGTINPKPYGLSVPVNSKNLEKAKLAAINLSKAFNDLSVKDGEIPYMLTDVKPDKELNPEYAKYIEDSKKVKFMQTFWFDSLPTDVGEKYRIANQKFFTGKVEVNQYLDEQSTILTTAVKN